MSRPPDRFGLLAGATITAIGVLLVLDQASALELDLGWLGVALGAATGLILLASGLMQDRE